MKIAIHTLGCKVNQYESEAIKGRFLEADGEIVGEEEYADVYIINTCTVTSLADRKSRQMLHRARKMNEDAIVVAAGCYVESAKNKIDEDLSIDEEEKSELYSSCNRLLCSSECQRGS